MHYSRLRMETWYRHESVPLCVVTLVHTRAYFPARALPITHVRFLSQGSSQPGRAQRRSLCASQDKWVLLLLLCTPETPSTDNWPFV